MRISTNWIKDLVDLDRVNLDSLALKVTKAGVNVEKVDCKRIDNLIVGYVESTSAHPDSDHLNVCMVNVGSSVLQIVCGASNVRAGIKVIVALVGAILPGGFEIKKSVIRGVESNGMICALFELGLEEKEGNYDKGIEELSSDAPIGLDAIKYLGLDDTVYTLDLNPNRNDCLSHLGFAYEVAAVLGRKVILPDVSYNAVDDNISEHLDLKIDTDNCSMYLAKMVKDVVISDSPDFIKQRLVSAGMRPINNVVDISNYIMLEYGQPLHFFDKDKLGDKLVIRMAFDDEKMVTLDNKGRTFNSSDILITDGSKPICVAGVMGGLNSDVDASTKNIVIESAIFNPYNVRYTSIRLDLRSEASLRFEKGLNYDYTLLALKRACHLLEKYASGKVLSGTLVHDKVDKKERVACVTLDKINSMLGMTLTDVDVNNSLNRLGFDFTLEDSIYNVVIPNRRLDVDTNSADLIEEIGRLYGYDNIESVLPVGFTKTGSYIGNVKFRKLISNRLRALGLNEARTYTLISETEDSLFNYDRGSSVKLLKAMSADKAIVRQSVIPGLLKVIDYNNARNVKDVMIYEISNTYSDNGEDTKISVALKGNYLLNNWNGVSVKVDFYLIKGIVENVLNYLGFKNRYSFVANEVNDIHPGLCAEVLIDREAIGYVGKVHPRVRKDDVFVFELSLNKLIDKSVKPIKHKEVSKYPDVNKDMAFIVKKDVPAESVINVIKRAGGRLLTEIRVFDVYVGENVESDEKSIAFSLTFSDVTKTLNDEEVTVVFNNIIKEVESKLGAKIRNK